MAQKHRLAALPPAETAAISLRRIEASAAQSREGRPGIAAAPPKAGRASRASRASRAVRAALGVLAALVIGLAVGAVTQWFPSEVIPASTSGGPWVLVSFLVALTAAGITSATARGLACMVGLAIGYYSVAVLHGFPVSGSTASFWMPAPRPQRRGWAGLSGQNWPPVRRSCRAVPSQVRAPSAVVAASGPMPST
jgi:hypothetical protein